MTVQNVGSEFPHPLTLLILQPTPFCNLDCSYCYLSHRNDRTTLSLDMIEVVMKNVLSTLPLSDSLKVCWHAGEPLVLPIEYYERAHSILEQYIPKTVKLTYNFQTNGTLIDPAWCEFFVKSGAEVGLSIDGPKRFHDSYRLNRAGYGSFDKALRSLKLIQEHRDLNAHVISVLSLEALRYPDLFYEFYRDLGIRSVAFNIQEVEGCNRQTTFNDGQAASLYSNFLKVFLRRRKIELLDLRIREIDDLLANMLRDRTSPLINKLAEPFCVLSVDARGNFSTFSPELLGEEHPRYGRFNMGHFGQHAMQLNNVLIDKMYSEIQDGLRLCQEKCAYFGICGGGSPVNKLYEHGTFCATETLECVYRIKLVADVLIEELTTALS